MADKQKLKDMLDAIIDGNNEQAQTDFHAYVTAKTKEVLHGEEQEEPSDDDVVDELEDSKTSTEEK